MASFPSQEHRPLKKPRLGIYGPDVYPQDKKQKEDELTSAIVKYGFSTMPPTKDEYGSARDSNPVSSKVGAAFSAIIAKKFDINTFPDQTKRRLLLNIKDNFYLAQISRGKAVLELWFRDLSSTKPLVQMAKKVPVFNKKEETFQKLCEENVPLFRCTWFIKMTNAYNTTLCEAAKTKKRQAMDPFLEWSQAFARYLREQLMKILEHYHGSVMSTGLLVGNMPSSATDFDQIMRNWNFGMQMAHYLYDEGLLDRHEFLSWLVELLEKLKVTDDTVLKLILAQILKYMSEFVQSQLLSRRLVFFCCKKLVQMCSDSMSQLPTSQSPSVPVSSDNISTAAPLEIVASQASLQSIFSDYCNCHQHRSLLLSICSVIQAVTLSCPSALVWHDLDEGKSSSSLSASPLDLLPCPVSCLPMPVGSDNSQIRVQLKSCEEQIVMRSKAAEIRWSSDKNQQSTIGLIVNKVLTGLEILDRHNFEKVESSNCLDVLYHKLFNLQPTYSKDGSDNAALNDATVNLICEWAVTAQRTGEHRAVVVAKLLEKYQCDVLSDKLSECDGMDDRDSNASDTGPSFTPPFQNLLMQFLDKNAPVFEENDSTENKQAFANLVLLFSELIRHDIFSHDAYICTLISRGDIRLSSNVSQSLSSVTPCRTDSIKSEGHKFDMPEEMKTEHDCHNPESEFGIFAFKDELRPSPDQPGSVKSSLEHSMFAGTPGQAHTPAPCYSQIAYTPGAPHTPLSVRTPAPHTPGASHTPGAVTPGSATSGATPTPGKYHPMMHTPNVPHTPGSLPLPYHQSQPVLAEEQLLRRKESSRHLIFVTHFPIAVDDVSCHESNQRLVVLFGVGRQREEARHLLKKVTKDVSKLFSKKGCLDTNSGDLSKLKKKKEKDQNDTGTNLENIFNKFRKLSFYDQHAVTNAVSKIVVEVVTNFSSANASYLPLIDNISYLFDLMEYCLNISHLLELAIKLLKEQPDVESQLMLKESCLAGRYTTSLCLWIVGVLRKYHACLLVSQEQAAIAFESLVKVVKHVDKPNDCTSPERSILAYLYDLYTSSYYLRTKYSDLFGGPCAKVKNTLYADVEPSSSNLRWEEHFSKDLMDNPKLKVEAQFVKQLNDTPANRYSFVCSAIVNICNCQSADRLNDIAILCAELTACCTALSSEWLGVLKALCWSSNHNCGFIDVLTQVDVGDFSIHDSLAVFTAILIARHCFTLEDLVGHVALQSLLAACPSVGSGGDPDAELGARLTCHLLLRLFQMMSTMPGFMPESRKSFIYVKSSCDRHLLEAEHKRINVGAVVAVLKAIMMLGDSCHTELKDSSVVPKKDTIDFMAILDDCSDLPLKIGASSQMKECMESAGLSDYAKYCLREICGQEWVREKFLKEPDQLFKADLLLDKMLSHKQAQQLVQMICYPGGVPSVTRLNESGYDEDDESEQRHHITRILSCMDQWSQRISSLELQLMVKQATPSEMPCLHDNIAKSTIEVFQQEADNSLNNLSRVGKRAIPGMDSNSSVWLIPPLIAKLTFQVQGRVLKTAGQVLETGNNFWSAKNSKDREKYLQRNTALLGNQPFLNLVLTCLKGQNEQREGLLKSLHDQLEKFVTSTKEQQDRGVPPDEKIQFMMQEALQLRLSLIGNMFDTIQHNNNLTQDWAILLMQLISNGIVDVQTNCELFTMVMDMLSVLIHGTLANDTSDKGEDNKKSYQSLIRKLKKELGERKSTSTDMVRQLLPLPKKYCEVIVCDTRSTDSKGGNKSQEVDRKHSLHISRKERVSPWEILEGHKNPAPLNLSWFGAVRMEKKPLKYEEQYRQLLYHTHSLRKPHSYFLEPPVLPPEDLDPKLDKLDAKPLEQILEPKLESSKLKKSSTKVKPIRKTSRNSITPTTNAFVQNVPSLNMTFARPDAFQQGPPPRWYGQPAYPHQINTPRAFTLTRPASKARMNTPGIFLSGGNWPQGVCQRPPLAVRNSNRVCAEAGMFTQQTGMLNQGFPGFSSYPAQAPQSLSLSQTGAMEQAQPVLNQSSFTPPFQGTNSALGLSNQSASYLSSQSSQQTQYPASSLRYAALPVMNNIGPQGSVPGGSMPNYGQFSSRRQVPAGQASNFNKQRTLQMSQQLPPHQTANSSSLMHQMGGSNAGNGNQPQNPQFPPLY